MDGNLSPEGSERSFSSKRSQLTTREFILINMAKMIVEFMGTAMIGVFYILLSDRQVGMLFGFWIITLFGFSISGSHFNPAITLALMLRSNSPFGEDTNHRLLGVLYIIAQILGAVVSNVICDFLVGGGLSLYVSPIVGRGGEPKEFAALISEVIGSFVFISLFMMSIDKETQFSRDKVVITFTMASSYIGSRLMSGGSLITGFRYPDEAPRYLLSGPLLNPALAFGQMVSNWNFSYWLQYLVGPLGASGLALVFYEHVFVRSLEYLNDMAEEESNQSGISMDERKENTRGAPLIDDDDKE